MPIALLIIGMALISSGIQDTQCRLGQQVASDFSGAGSFWYWVAGISAAGFVGSYEGLQNFSRLTIGLIVLVFVLSNRGVFSSLQAALANPLPTIAKCSASGNLNAATGTPTLSGALQGQTTQDPRLHGQPSPVPLDPYFTRPGAGGS